MVRFIKNILGAGKRIIYGTDWPAALTDLSVKAILVLETPK